MRLDGGQVSHVRIGLTNLAPMALRPTTAEDALRGQPLTDAQRDEGFRCYDSEDFRIGVQAFLAKARPDFLGR